MFSPIFLELTSHITKRVQKVNEKSVVNSINARGIRSGSSCQILVPNKKKTVYSRAMTI